MVDIHLNDNKTDNELVGLSLKDPDQFLYLSKRYEKKLLRYIIRISKFSREEAEDILQEVFIKTYYNLNGFDSSLKFSSWIYRIAHNETVSAIRKKSVRPAISLQLGEFEKFGDIFEITEDIDNKINRKIINQVLSRLDEKYREVLILRFLDEKDYIEISDILKKPISTVGNLIMRGKKIFKEEYEKLTINKFPEIK